SQYPNGFVGVAVKKKIEIRKTSQAAPVRRSERKGRTMRPFSFRRIPRLTFVSCQPMRRRSKKPSLREGRANGPGPPDDGTVGGGDHIGIAEPSGPGYINPSEERPSREAPSSSGEDRISCGCTPVKRGSSGRETT